MEDHRVVAVGMDQPIFRAAAEARHLRSGQPLTEILRKGSAQVGAARFDEAANWYRAVTGSQRLAAQLRIASLLAKQKGVEAGREYLKTVKTDDPQQATQLVLAEAQLLRDAKSYPAAFDLLSRAAAEQPESTDILYDRAMTAEKLDRLDVVEADLRKVIALNPEHAHAYNALGYTFAERGTRLDEALALITKAHELAPDDPFVLDSLGWVNYRLGKTVDGLTYLRSAYAARPDPEIAAHLGEVLWAEGRRDEAKKVWSQALAKHPDNKALIDVMRKFKAGTGRKP